MKNLLLFDFISLTSRLDMIIYSNFLYLAFYIFLFFHQWINVFTIDNIILSINRYYCINWLRNNINQINFCNLFAKIFLFFLIRVISIDFVNLFISFFLFIHCMNISFWFINNQLYLLFCVLKSFSQFVQIDFYQQFRVISFHFENTRILSFFSNQTSWNRKT